MKQIYDQRVDEFCCSFGSTKFIRCVKRVGTAVLTLVAVLLFHTQANGAEINKTTESWDGFSIFESEDYSNPHTLKKKRDKPIAPLVSPPPTYYTQVGGQDGDVKIKYTFEDEDCNGKGKIVIKNVFMLSNGSWTSPGNSTWSYDWMDDGANIINAQGTDVANGENVDTLNLSAGSYSIRIKCLTIFTFDEVFNFTILNIPDQTAPYASCKSDFQVNLNNNGVKNISVALLNDNWPPSSDNCAIANMWVSDPQLNCSHIALSPYPDTLFVEDDAGNISYCITNITVIDDISPSAVCNDVTVYLDENGDGILLPEDVDGGSTDNCTSPLICSLSEDEFDCSDIGSTINVTCTIMDEYDNASTCNSTITVLDTLAPVMVCKPKTLYLNASGEVWLSPAMINDGSSDNCDNYISLSVSAEGFYCDNLGDTLITLYGEDDYGNIDSCVATVTIKDAMYPTISCPADLSGADGGLSVDPGACSADLVLADLNGPATGTDNCSTVITNDFSDGNYTVAGGQYTVVWKSTDPSGNSVTCNQQFEIIDDEAPEAICKDKIVYVAANGLASIEAADVNDGSSDNCDANPALSIDISSFDCDDLQFPGDVNTVEVTLTVTAGGLTDACTSQITVLDTIKPTIVCPATETVGMRENKCWSKNNYTNFIGVPVTNDNCSVESVANNAPAPNLTGDALIVWTVTDSSGNTATCEQQLLLVDNVSPEVTCIASPNPYPINLDGAGNAAIDAADLIINAFDNCVIDDTTISQSQFTCNDIGTGMLTVTVTDTASNIASCDVNIVVIDAVDPVANCKNIDVYLNNLGKASIAKDTINDGSSDACGPLLFAIDIDEFDCSDIANNPIEVTLTVTDGSGNSDQCIGEVTVIDSVKPKVLVQNITASVDASGSVTIEVSDIDNGTGDACGIDSLRVTPSEFDCSDVSATAHEVYLVAIDNNNNTDSAMALVTIIDDIAPMVACHPALNLYLDGTGNASITADSVELSSSDNCGVPSLALDSSNFNCANSLYTVTLTATDVNGLTNTCTSILTILDTISPTITCPGDIAADTESDTECSALVVLGDPTAADNCSYTISNNAPAPTRFASGTHTVLWTATDPSSNSTSCEQTIVISDVHPPVASTDPLPTIESPCEVILVAPTALDACDGSVTGVSNLASDTVDMQGTTIVTWTYTDAAGNSSSQMQTIIIDDNSAPSVACKQEADIYLLQDGFVALTPADITLYAADNCGNGTSTVYPDTIDCDHVGLGPIEITLTVVDQAGNESQCVCNVSVLDKLAPQAECMDTTLYLDQEGEATLTFDHINNGSFDNCEVLYDSLSQTDFGCDHTDAVNNVTMYLSDPSGNTSQCNAEVIVLDTLAPVMDCQNITVNLDSTGNVSIIPDNIAGDTEDNCEIALLSIDVSAFNCGMLGANNVQLNAIDVHGNEDSCVAVVTVIDEIVPTIECPDTVIAYTDQGLCASNQVYLGNPNIWDNCPNPIVENDGEAPYALGYTDVTWTIEDASGNNASCVQVVNVLDVEPPHAECVASLNLYLDNMGNKNIVVADINNASTDNCTIATTSLDTTMFDCSDVGEVNPVILTVVDGSGNTDVCEAIVNVIDSISPEAICKDTTIGLDIDGEATIAASDLDNGSNDACGIIPVVFIDGQTTSTLEEFDCSDDVVTLTLLVTDINGNTSTCSSIVTLIDTIAPEVICEAVAVELDVNGMASVLAVQLDEGSTDNCAIDTMFLNDDEYDYTCADLGNNNVTLTVVDESGNEAQCANIVSVVDVLAPSVVCKNITVNLDAAGNVSILPTDVDNGSTDNCGIEIYALSDSSFTCDDTGANSIWLYAYDESGNVDSCTSIVTVIDEVNPAAICMDAEVQLDALGNGSISTSDIDNASNDACGIASLSLDTTAFDCSDVGELNPVVLTVTDVNGNVSTCSANVVVLDEVAPEALCLATINVELDQYGAASISHSHLNNGSNDACGIDENAFALSQSNFDCANIGIVDVVLTVYDVNSNSSTCETAVNVIDAIDPTIICPADVEVFVDAASCAATNVVLGDATAADNCTVASISNNGSEPYALGATNVVWKAMDQSGNSETCIQVVTVIDNIAPVPDLAVLPVLEDQCEVTAIAPTATDNCPDVVVTATTEDPLIYNTQGTHTIHWVYTDNAGNETFQEQTVVIQDSESPLGICEHPFSVYLDASGVYNVQVSDLENGSTDNCAIETQYVQPSILDCEDVTITPFQNSAPVRVYLYSVDYAGNVGVCYSDISVYDAIAPVAICNPTSTVYLDEDGLYSTSEADIDNGSYDNCSIIKYELDNGDFNCDDIGITQLVKMTVYDSTGNSAYCYGNVIVLDNLAPEALCVNSLALNLDENGLASIEVADIDAGTADNCKIKELSIDITAFDCDDVTLLNGYHDVTLTALDVNGNSSSCVTVVEVIDNMAPSIDCPEDITHVLETEEVCYAVLDLGLPVLSDNCEASIATNDALAQYPVGTSNVTWSTQDPSGNVSTCVQKIIVIDEVKPKALCKDTTVYLDVDAQVAIGPDHIDNGSSDNCGIDTRTVSPKEFFCMQVGPNDVTLTVTDIHANVNTCLATVMVVDTIPATATCNDDYTLYLDEAGEALLEAQDISVIAMDSCGIASLELDQSAFNCSHVGAPISVTLTATDVNGNVSTCSSDVTVIDNLAPVVICESIAIELDENGEASIAAEQLDEGSTDNCEIATFETDQTQFDCGDLGSNPVVLTVTDVNDNAQTCATNVVVIDQLAPVVVCQNVLVELDDDGLGSISIDDIDNGSSDNCGPISLSLSNTAYSCADVGSNSVWLYASDPSGNIDSCEAIVTVEDNVLPEALCQAITIQLDENGNASVSAEEIDNGSDDACGIASLALSQEDFSCANVGSNTVTLTVTDNNGNVSTCDAIVTVEDNLPPVIECADFTVQLDATGSGSISASDITASASDNCGIASSEVSTSEFACADVGEHTVTLTVTDVNGNVSTCDATVTVEDNVAPDALCQDLTIYLDIDGLASIAAADVDNGSSDACGIASLAIDQSNFECEHVGDNAITLTVTDENGNVSTCASNVEVIDNIAPTTLCADDTVYLDENGLGDFAIGDIDLGSSDACGIASISMDHEGSVTCADTENDISVTLTFTDVNNNVSTCTQSITVLDILPPKVKCFAQTAVLDENGLAYASIDVACPDYEDNCGIDTLYLSQTEFTCEDEGHSPILVHVFDLSGNETICLTNIHIFDTISPTVICTDFMLELDQTGNATLEVANIDGGSTDNCGILNMTLSQTEFDCDDTGIQSVTLTVEDEYENVSSCVAEVEVIDAGDPMAMCMDIQLALDANGLASLSPADIDAGSGDGCSDFTLAIDVDAFDCSNIGDNNVILTITDLSGNTAMCTSVVSVIDDLAPDALCTDVSVYLDENGSASIAAADLDNGSSDNCAIASYEADLTAFDCSHLGDNAVILTVTDGAGNASTCTSNVSVLDTVVPAAVCQNITVQLDENGLASVLPADLDGGSSDNCAIAASVLDVSAFSCANIGDNEVTLTVTDASGNSASCTATVTVEDVMPPVVACANIELELDENGIASIDAADVIADASDNCAIASSSVSMSAFSCDELGLNTVSVTVLDASGNSASCNAEVTVVDNIAPDAICANISIELDENGAASIVAADIDGGSTDNCAIVSYEASLTAFDCSHIGVNEVTLTVIDASGNSSECIAEVTVEDNIAPDAICQDYTLYLDEEGNGTLTAADIDGGSDDNCDNVSLAISQETFDCDHVGDNAVTLTVTDGEGNSSNCIATVTVVDEIAPEVLVQHITVYLDETGSASIDADDIDAGSNDACGIESRAAAITEFDCDDAGEVKLVSLIVTDVNGNVGINDAEVTVMDTISPDAVCQNIIIYLDDNGFASYEAEELDSEGLSSDNCTVYLYDADNTEFNCDNVGANTATLTVSDESGNSTSCTAIVSVIDTISPDAVCENMEVYLDASGSVSIDAIELDGGSTDNCEIDFEAFEMDHSGVFGCDDVDAEINIELTVYDVNGNSATCTSSIEVLDTVAPVIECDNVTLVLDANGMATAELDDALESVTDACGIASAWLSQYEYTCDDAGVNLLVVFAEDVNGNIGHCNTSVFVADTTAPIVACMDITIELDEDGLASINSSDIDGGSSDNCNFSEVDIIENQFDCNDLGENQVKYILTDDGGNMDSCIAIVTVEDNIAPQAMCNNLTLSLNADGVASTDAWAVDHHSSDNCGIASYEINQSDFDCSHLGVNIVELTVTDASGNQDECSSVITVIDLIDPVIVECTEDITVSIDGGSCTADVVLVEPTATDNCSVTFTNNAPEAFEVGNTVVTWTAVDPSGNVAICVQSVTVQDLEGPSIVCPDDVTVNVNDIGCYATDVQLGDPIATDNCGIESITNNGSIVYPVGSTEITWVVEDEYGNSASCNQMITVVDDINPTIECPEDITVSTDLGSCEATGVVLGAPIIADNCVLSANDVTNDAPAAFPLGETIVTWSVVDAGGNVASCTQLVTVEGDEAPSIACSDDLVVAADLGSCEASIVLDEPGIGSCLNVTVSSDAPASFSIGETTVTWTAIDEEGNVSTCAQVITVVDEEMPVISACAEDMVISLTAGNCEYTGSIGDVTATDNCGDVTISNDAPAAFGIGTTTVIWTVEDAAGNSVTCAQSITVNDVSAPSIACEADVTVSADAGSCEATDVVLAEPTYADDCSAASISNDAPAVYPLGETTVTWTAVDAAGNEATCTQLVTVEDNEAPSIECLADMEISADAGSCETTLVLDMPVAFDNCSIVIPSSDAPASFSIGATTVTWTATDDNGNQATCEQIITVVDEEMPVISACAEDMVISLTAGNCEYTGSIGDVTATDNCGDVTISNDAPAAFGIGTTTVIWTVEDAAGNSVTCAQSITVNDVSAPSIACEADVTVSADAGSCEATDVVLAEPTYADDCSAASISNDAPAVYPLGETTVTWTAVDAAGNQATCTQTVTVVDEENPLIIGLSPITAECEVVELTAPSVSDNCVGTISIAHDAQLPITDQGVYIVTWTAVDASGNVATATQEITIDDVTAPVPDEEVLADVSEACELTSLPEPSATDNCTAVTVSHDAQFPITESATVTWTYEDENGNVSTQTQEVIISDEVAPIAIALDLSITLVDGSASITAQEVGFASSDNCGIDNMFVSQETFSSAGQFTVTLTVVDNAGNESTADFTVIVEDNEAPTPLFVSLAQVSDACEVAFLETPGVTDNSGEVTITHDVELPITEQGITVVTWTYEDPSGNVTTQLQEVYIENNDVPVFDAEQLENVVATCAIESLIPPTATDDCSGQIVGVPDVEFPLNVEGITTITWAYTDGHGHVVYQTQDVVINDIDASASESDNVISLEAIGASYEWINCETGEVIAGENEHEFTATANGEFAAIITVGDCSDTTDCFEITGFTNVGLHENLADFVLEIYPNPTVTGNFSINYDGQLKSVEMINMLGKKVLSIENPNKVIDVTGISTGKYLVRITNVEGYSVVKTIVISTHDKF